MTSNNRVDARKLNEELGIAGEFSVYQFFEDDSYERVRHHVSDVEAVNAAKHYCNSVAVKMKLVKRVIIVDGGDLTCFEWIAGKGVVFPPRASADSDGEQEGR